MYYSKLIFPRSHFKSLSVRGQWSFLSLIKTTKPHKSQKWSVWELTQTEAVHVCLISQYGDKTTWWSWYYPPPLPSLSESNTFQQCCTSPCSSTQWQLLTIMALRELILMAVTGSRRKFRPASVNSRLKPRRMGFSVEGEMCRAGLKLRPFCDLFIISNMLHKHRHTNQPASHSVESSISTCTWVIRCFLFHIFYKVKFPNCSVWCKPPSDKSPGRWT